MKNSVFLSFLFVGSSLCAQLTGIKNIPGDYPTLATAITDLNTQGVGPGGVTIILNQSETGPAGGYIVTASGSASDPIILNGNGNIITASGALVAGALNDALIKIIGGDYITISGFTMQENGANLNITPVSNNMTEWGIALLYTSTTDGAQHNTITGNMISLNRNYSNTFGIYSNTRHTASVVGTTADITATSGSNSANVVTNNTISNVNSGIAFIGSGVQAYMDTGNDIGGSSSSNGNIISNWGGAPAGSPFVSNSNSNYCILMNHQKAFNVSNNTFTSALVPPMASFRGIVQDYSSNPPTGSFTNTITNNSITMNSSQTAGSFRTIETLSGVFTMTLNITYNHILNCSITGTNSSATFEGIIHSGTCNTLNISNNIFEGNSTSATTGGFTGIWNSASPYNFSANNNQFGTSSAGAVTFTAACSGTVTCIMNNFFGIPNGNLAVSGNDFRGIVHAVNSSSPIRYIYNNSGLPNTNISNNTFTSLTANTTGDIYFINNSTNHNANTTHTINNNSIVGGFSKILGGGNVFFYNSYGFSGNTVTEINSGNNFSNMSFTGSTSVIGWRTGDGTVSFPFGSHKTVTNNTFSNITCGSGASGILDVSYSSGTAPNNVTGNTISNITSVGNLICIYSYIGCQNIFLNTVNGIYSTGTNSVITGLYTGTASIQNIYQNRIYDVEAQGTNGAVRGMNLDASCTIYNNLIGDLRAPNSANSFAIIGFYSLASVGYTLCLYHNTMYLNASSSGTNFGTACLWLSSGPNLVMRNNIFVNASTSNGNGRSTVFYVAITPSYSNLSNNNCFFAGTPSATNLIFWDGTNSDQTLAAFQSRVAPRDSDSVTEDPLFISTSGASPYFLHIANGTSSLLESGAVLIPSINSDYDLDARPGPVGSVNGGGIRPDIGADEFDGFIPCNGMPVAGTASASPAIVCGSDSLVLSLSGESIGGGISVQWMESGISGGPYSSIPGATTSSYTLSSLSSSTFYVAIITCNNTGLSDTSSEIAVTYHAQPAVVNANATASTICAGDSIALTGTGATSYSWSGGISNAVPFSPAVSGIYIVTGTDANGCTDTASVSITVNALPVVSANSSSSSVCDGGSVLLFGSGANTFSWSGGVTNAVSFIPTISSTYTVTGIDVNGCQDIDSITIIVNALPVVIANATQDTICASTSITLSGIGASTYSWSGGVTDGVSFIPTASADYFVTGTDANNCSSMDTISIVVNALPPVSLSLSLDTLCSNAGFYNLTGGSPSGGTWNGPGITGSTLDPSLLMTGNFTTVVYSYTDANGCSATGSDSLYVDICNQTIDPGISMNAYMYPNPCFNVLTIDLIEFSGNLVNIEIQNSLGETLHIFVVEASKTEIDMSMYPTGVYMIKLTSERVQTTTPIIKY